LFSIISPLGSFIFKVTTVIVAKLGNDTLSFWKGARRVIGELLFGRFFHTFSPQGEDQDPIPILLAIC
jgi:hypothetical protein